MRKVRQRQDDAGMTTAEYAVGTLGAVSIAGLIVAKNPISDFVGKVFREAARLVVSREFDDVLTLPRLVVEAVQNVVPW